MVWPLALKLTTRLAPLSAETLTAPLLAMPPVSIAAVALSRGASGANVSSTKLVVPLRLALPAGSVAVALTLTVP